MRCVCCDVELTPYEATRRAKSSGEFLDMCNTCYSHISEDVPSIVRKDLANKNFEDDGADDLDQYGDLDSYGNVH